nr:hypothetical protein [Angustibacter aerolatus]
MPAPVPEDGRPAMKPAAAHPPPALPRPRPAGDRRLGEPGHQGGRRRAPVPVVRAPDVGARDEPARRRARAADAVPGVDRRRGRTTARARRVAACQGQGRRPGRIDD